MGKVGEALLGAGKGALDGMAQMGGLPGNNLMGIAGGALDPNGRGGGMLGAGGPMSGINLMNMLFEKLGFIGRKKENEHNNYDPTGIVGPRD